MRRTSRSKKCGCTSIEPIDLQGNTLEFLLSPTRDAEAAKRFFLKALHSTADSAPQAHLVEEQVAQPTALTDTTSSRQHLA